jgi:hypothetical protein
VSSPAQVHSCPSCRCGLPRCPQCGYVLPDHQESPGLSINEWCSRSSVVRAVKADEKKRGVYNPKAWR